MWQCSPQSRRHASLRRTRGSSPRETTRLRLTAGRAVARIAYLSSHLIVSVQPALSLPSIFSPHLHHFAANHAHSLVDSHLPPTILSVREHADPFLDALAPARHGRLTAITTASHVLIRAVPHLDKLVAFPVVIHVALHPSSSPDWSHITGIRNTGFAFLQSNTLQEAQDLALTAHALAIRSGKGVIHFFDPATSQNDLPIAVEHRQLCANVLQWDQPAQLQTQSLATATAQDASRASSVSSASERHHTSTGAASPAESVTTLATEPARVNSQDIDSVCAHIWSSIKSTTGRSYAAFHYTGPPNAEAALFLFGSDPGLFSAEFDKASAADFFARVGLITPTLYRPWLSESLCETIPSSVTRIAVLEQIKRKTTRWGPVLLDLLVSLKSTPVDTPPHVVGYQLGSIGYTTVTQALSGIFQNLLSANPIQNLEIGAHPDSRLQSDPPRAAPALENAYMKMLDQVFGERLYIANALGSPTVHLHAGVQSSPEFGFGALMARKEHRQRFVDEVQQAVKHPEGFATAAPVPWLRDWALAAGRPDEANKLAPQVIARLATDGSAVANRLLRSQGLFRRESEWLVGSDAWAYDLGNSGVHHVLASGERVNMLIIDSTPYSARAAQDAARRKKDIGLYAMNFGHAYVASVAVYSSYTHVLQALLEAEAFDGPAVVLAYLPYTREDDSPVTVLQETKKAVDAGYWPLYRWDPRAAEERGEDCFRLDSERIKQELRTFLARDNHLSQMMRRHPRFHANLSESYGSEVRAAQKQKAKDAYAVLLEGLQGAPLTVLYASDNGNAETLAKRLAARARARGLKPMCMAMDDYPLEDLAGEESVVCVTSTAGQGEFPQNGRALWEGLKATTDMDLARMRFAVFALGDSHYWPRKEDRHYYNKPGKDLAMRLAALGATAMVDVGMGDDQDPDGYQTGYAAWEPRLWDALGVGHVTGLPEEPPPITNEDIKRESNFLRGTIREGLEDGTTGAISAADQQLTKFHGTYMQDDRDVRDERKAQGLEPAYSFMIRCRLPGGVATPAQWLQMDEIAGTLGNGTMKLTTRQTFQFHGVVKGRLRPAMQAINRACMTTIAACGDINRNVMCSSLPETSALHAAAQATAQRISDHLLPSTTAYHEIWLQETHDEGSKKVQVAGDAVQDHEPLYGPTYLPRKFKITIAVPPHNDTDVYAHDIGLVAIRDADGPGLCGFNVLVGGGMGATHNNVKTYPQIGRMFGFVPRDVVHLVCEKIMLVQREHGDRTNRKHARLKYTLDGMGIPAFRDAVQALMRDDERVGDAQWAFADPRPFAFDRNVDALGWTTDERGLHHFTAFIENGRVEDSPTHTLRSGLRAVAHALATHGAGEFRLTANQHVVIANIPSAHLAATRALLAAHGLATPASSGLRSSASACVAFPTCGLAMAESERALPGWVSALEPALRALGLAHEPLVLRMTGCPNGCARPWLAEVGLVGTAPGTYNMYLGGGFHGQRLGKLWRRNVDREGFLGVMGVLLKGWKEGRTEGERFGDWCVRSGVVVETVEGRDFHGGVREEEEEE